MSQHSCSISVMDHFAKPLILSFSIALFILLGPSAGDAIAAAPTISGVSPNPVTGSTSGQTVTINGTGFVNKPTVFVTWGTGSVTLPAAAVTFVSSTQLQMLITVQNDPDNWTVKVTNPNGSGSSSAFPFRVVAPTPVITNLTTNPNPPTTAGTFSFTINGNNFFPAGALILVTGPSCAPCTIPNNVLTTKTATTLTGPATLTTAGTYSFVVQNGFDTQTGASGPKSGGTNVTVAGGPITLSITTTSLNPATATVGVGYGAQQAVTATGGATPYSWSVSGQPNGMGINSSSGAVFGTPTVAGTFNLTVTVRDSSNPQKTASKVLSLTVAGSTPAPSISSISPNPVTLNQDTVLIVNGANFQNGFSAAVSTSGGTFPIANAGLTFVSSGQIKVAVKMGGLSGYTASLTITNPNGSSASSSFQVTEAPSAAPVITSITPPQVPFNQVTTLTVNGSNFQSGFKANVAGFDIANSGVSFINPNKVQVQVLMKGAPPYTAEVIITNPDSKSGKGSFQVTQSAVSPTFSIQPSSGAIGTKFTSTGRNFTPFGDVKIKVKWANGGVIEGIMKRADGTGFFSYDYTSQPGDPLGTHTLEVTDVASGKTTSAQETFLSTSGSDAMSVTNDTQQAKANSKVSIKWRIKNTGTTTWNNYKLVFVPLSNSQNLTTTGSNSFAFPAAFTPGQEGELPLDMKAPPTKGTYFSYWQLQNAQGQAFGAQFYAQITVNESAKSNVMSGNPSGTSGTGDSPSTNSKTENDPVNTANGNYIYDRDDLQTPGRGLDFVFSRTYNSVDNTPSSIGNGWSHSFN